MHAYRYGLVYLGKEQSHAVMIVEFVGGPFDGKRLELHEDKHEYRASVLEASGLVKKYVYQLRIENGERVRQPDGACMMCYRPEETD